MTSSSPRWPGRAAPGITVALKRAFRIGLPAWFQKHRRTFPWRTRRTPYRVWVSEIMLQQTRADQAVPYYRKFLRRFPTLKRLAAASSREVLRAWAGLGYYARARHLHKAARFIVRRHSGRFPSDPQAIRALPGIGNYTAAAIGSLAFGHETAVLDGNVIRVLSRVMALEELIHTRRARHRLQEWADALRIPGRAIRFTLSVGCASSQSFARPTIDRLIRAADQALYRAKKDGRNRVAVATPGRTPRMGGAPSPPSPHLS